MKWLQANPVGLTLAVASGILVLLALLITILWTLPVSVSIDENAANNADEATPMVFAGEVGEMRQYEVINQKPVFNESRLPVIELEIEALEEEEEDDSGIAVADAPDVKLTGIIITPGMKLASLTPNDASVERVMAYEGDSLTGEFVGWHISKINPRQVVLESRDGQSMELELEVHDSQIQAPIKPATTQKVAETKQGEPGKPPANSPAAVTADEGEEPVSRAEQIRQRIAERREELRREQEQAKQSNNTRGGAPQQSGGSSAYQRAIQSKIRNETKDKSSDDNEDG